MSDSGVDRAVLCQYLGQSDNTYIAEFVGSDASRFSGVAVIDRSAAESTGQLAPLAADGTFRRVRVAVDMSLANPGFAISALGLGVNVVLFGPDGLENVVDVMGRPPAVRGRSAHSSAGTSRLRLRDERDGHTVGLGGVPEPSV